MSISFRLIELDKTLVIIVVADDVAITNDNINLSHLTKCERKYILKNVLRAYYKSRELLRVMECKHSQEFLFDIGCYFIHSYRKVKKKIYITLK